MFRRRNRMKLINFVAITSILHLCSAKVFTECELAQELFERHTIPRDDIYKHLCVAYGLKTDEIDGGSAKTGHLGIYRVGAKWWCGHDEPAGTCNMLCSDLLDDDITDDVKCAIHIFSSHKLDGWGKTETGCQKHKKTVDDCLKDDEEAIELRFVDKTITELSVDRKNSFSWKIVSWLIAFIALGAVGIAVWKKDYLKTLVLKDRAFYRHGEIKLLNESSGNQNEISEV